MNDDPKLRLRPHHLLCLQTFVGRGYSDEFVAQMTVIQNRLISKPETEITLIYGADDLCRHCPNCADGKCSSEKPALFDRLSAHRLAHTPQEEATDTSPPDSEAETILPVHLKGIPEHLRISEELIRQCCPGCEWKPLCTEVIRKGPKPGS